MKPILLLPTLLLVTLFAPALSAQNIPSRVGPHAQEWIKEKFSIAHQQLTTETVGDLQIREGDKINDNESIISAADAPESEITAIVNPTDTSKMVAVAMMTSGNLFVDDLTYPIYYSRDFGDTWQRSDFKPETIFPAGDISAGGGDPVLAYDKDGKLHLVWFKASGDFTLAAHSRFYHAISIDDGITWTVDDEPIARARGQLDLLGRVTGPVIDKEWLIADNNPSSPYYGNLYLLFAEITAVNLDSANYQIFAKTWEPGSGWSARRLAVSRDDLPLCQFVSPTLAPDGTIYFSVFGISSTDPVPGQYLVRSSDGGQSFSSPTLISHFYLACFLQSPTAPPCVPGISPERTFSSGYLYYNFTNGDLYAIWYAEGLRTRVSEGTDIYFAYSTDEGGTWSSPVVVNQDTNNATDNFMPTGVVSPTGSFHITWYDNREGEEDTQYYGIEYDPDSRSFGEEFTISGAATNFRTVGNANGRFGVGEYNTTLYAGGYLIPVWADGRSNDGNLNIYMAMVREKTGTVAVNSLTNDHLQLSIGPNPVSTELTLTLSIEKVINRLGGVIIDVNGRLIRRLPIPNRLLAGTHTLQTYVGNLPAGTYFVILESSDTGRLARSFLRR